MRRSPVSTVAPDAVATSTLSVETRRAGFTDITREIAAFLAEAKALEGFVTLALQQGHIDVEYTKEAIGYIFSAGRVAARGP